MITAPYKDIPHPIASVMQAIIPENDSYHQGHARRTARTLQVLLDQNPTGKLLELGTSNIIPIALRALKHQLSYGITVTQFDTSRPSKGLATLMMSEEDDLYMSVPCFCVDLETQALPCDDETFDFVLCCEVIEHMERDPMFMLAEVNRVLKPGGTLIITTPNVVSSWGITKMLRGIEPYFYMQYHTSGDLYRHNYEYSIHSLMKLVKAAGFDGSIWTEDTFEDPNTVDIARLKAAGYNITHTGDNIFTVARKIGPVVDRMPMGMYTTY